MGILKEDIHAQNILFGKTLPPAVSDPAVSTQYENISSPSLIPEFAAEVIEDRGFHDHLENFEATIQAVESWPLKVDVAPSINLANTLGLGKLTAARLMREVRDRKIIDEAEAAVTKNARSLYFGQNGLRALAALSYEVGRQIDESIRAGMPRSDRWDIERVVENCRARLQNHPLLKTINSSASLENQPVHRSRALVVEPDTVARKESHEGSKSAEETVVFSSQISETNDNNVLDAEIHDFQLETLLKRVDDVIDQHSLLQRSADKGVREISRAVGLRHSVRIVYDHLRKTYMFDQVLKGRKVTYLFRGREALHAFAVVCYTARIVSRDPNRSMGEVIPEALRRIAVLHDMFSYAQYLRPLSEEELAQRKLSFNQQITRQEVSTASSGVLAGETMKDLLTTKETSEGEDNEMAEKKTEETQEESVSFVVGEHNFPKFEDEQQREELRRWDAKKIEQTRILLAKDRYGILSYHHMPFFVAMTVVALDAYWDPNKELQKVDFRRDVFMSAEIIGGLRKVENVFEIIRQTRRVNNPAISHIELNKNLNLYQAVLMVQRQLGIQ